MKRFKITEIYRTKGNGYIITDVKTNNWRAICDRKRNFYSIDNIKPNSEAELVIKIKELLQIDINL